MLAKSLVACLLSIPAAFSLVGALAVVTPDTPAVTVPVLMMVFPVWVAVACCSYLIEDTRVAAGVLLATACACSGFIVTLRTLGWALI
ncbi:MAG: hypothetical protein AAGI72_23070 [Pseudomonadota bacterium]